MLMQQLKADLLVARKKREDVSLLTTLIGEASMVGKNAGNRETTDDEVVQVIKKFLKNISESQKVATGDMLQKLNQEVITLKAYLPPEISSEELETLVKELIKENPSMGALMKALKAKLGSAFDGQAAKVTFNKVTGS